MGQLLPQTLAVLLLDFLGRCELQFEKQSLANLQHTKPTVKLVFTLGVNTCE